MITGKEILVLITAAATAVLTACGGSTTNVQNPPPPAASNVAITLQQTPTGSISLNGSMTLTAVVTDDPSDAGVDWSLLCPNNSDCGTLSPLHTASGDAAKYIPPATISGNSQTFIIEAFATTDHSSNETTSITVTGYAANLKGTYIFATQGSDANGPFQLAGAIVLDGNGVITSGEQTHSDYLLTVSDPVTGGSYYIGPDGRGTLTLITPDVNIGQGGVENLTLVMLSSSRALIATVDDPNLPPSTETSSGTLDLQTSTTPPTAGYAFAVSGTDISLQPMVMGGIFRIDSPNTISGSGSVADENLAGALTSGATLSGTLTPPDSFGSLKLNLTTSFARTSIQFTGYIVDDVHIKLIESDNTEVGPGIGSTAGVAIGQGSSTGTFTANQSFAGNYVFSIQGEDFTGLPSSLGSVGQFTADTNGNLIGYDDEGLNGFGIQISDSLSGSYVVDPTGTGRVDSSVNFDSNGAGPEFIFYLAGNGNPALVLDSDVNIGSVGVGFAPTQAAAQLSFDGSYGLSFTQGNGGLENDATGQFTVDGTTSNLAGIVDTNLSFSPQLSTSITGSFGAISPSGRFTGELTNTFFPTPGTMASTLAVAFYLVDSGHGFFIETDSLYSGELTFGSFAMRTPVCPTCPKASQSRRSLVRRRQ